MPSCRTLRGSFTRPQCVVHCALFVASSTPVPRKLLQLKLSSDLGSDLGANETTVPRGARSQCRNRSQSSLGRHQILAVPVAHDYSRLVLPRPTRSLVQGVSVSAITPAPWLLSQLILAQPFWEFGFLPRYLAASLVITCSSSRVPNAEAAQISEA
jgi:hypothetical protein